MTNKGISNFYAVHATNIAKSPTITKHAADRLQQRGIPQVLIDLLFQFGDIVHIGHGFERIHFQKRSQKKVRAYLGNRDNGWFDKYRGVYLIARDGKVITCGYQTKRILN